MQSQFLHICNAIDNAKFVRAGEADGESGVFTGFQETSGACSVPGASSPIGNWIFAYISPSLKPIRPLRDPCPVPCAWGGDRPVAGRVGVCDCAAYKVLAPRGGFAPEGDSTLPSPGRSSCTQESFQPRGEGI